MTARRRLVVLLGACLGALSAAGCGSTSSSSSGALTLPGGATLQLPTSSGGGVAACGLLSTADVAGVLGVPMKDGVPGVTLDASCRWASVTPGRSVTLRITSAAAYQATKVGAQAAGASVQDISGLGDDAYLFTLSTGGGQLSTVHVHKGGVYFTVQVVNVLSAGAPVADSEKALAEKAVSRL